MSGNVLITGGAKGIGRKLVESFIGAGYTVCFTYNNSFDAAMSLSEIGATAIHGDVSTPEGCGALVSEALGQLGTVDILINNAGISQQKLFTDITNGDWAAMVAVNLSAPFYITRGILPNMISKKSGRIINISSMWGVSGASCEVHYSAVKAGLIGMTKALAAEVAPSGITVNAIAPGVIDTDMFQTFSEETRRLVLEDIPVGRVGTPFDVANAALFLASEHSSFITGQVLGVNGGMVI